MKTKALCTLLAPVLAVGGFLVWPRSNDSLPPPASAPPKVATAAPARTATIEFVELHTAVEQGMIKAQFLGNGRDKMRAVLTNSGDAPLKVQADAGQMLEAGTNAIVVVRSAMVEVAPGASAEMALQTCATRSTNKVAEVAYKLTYHKTPRLQTLLAYAGAHLEITPGATQTAALALLENLPLSAVAKFAPAAGELTSRFNTDAYRVETTDLIGALATLRAIGAPESALALTVDPQLKVEAMIEPLSRAAAMQYYGITAATEWEYWKTELLSGAPATRHYALYGIARFYPEIALEMLPAWARETKTNAVYRLAALQALADTQRVEALPLLRTLADELGLNSELGRAARGAADHLDQRLAQLATKQTVVAFRSSTPLSQF